MQSLLTYPISKTYVGWVLKKFPTDVRFILKSDIRIQLGLWLEFLENDYNIGIHADQTGVIVYKSAKLPNEKLESIIIFEFHATSKSECKDVLSYYMIGLKQACIYLSDPLKDDIKF